MNIDAQVPLAPPPRPVPFLLRAQMLFGRVSSFIGWAFFSVGMIFVLVFNCHTTVTTWYYFRNPRTAPGAIVEVKITSASESDGSIYAYKYSFRAEGADFEGISYDLGRHHSSGEQVEVEYVEGHPSISRIRGMRRALFGAGVLFVLVFPLLGLAFIVASVRGGLKAIRLLRHGMLGWGELVSKEPTNVRINNRTVYLLTFEFQPQESGTAQAFARSHEPEKLQDDRREPLLYDPFRTERAILLDSLPGSPTVDLGGNLRPGNSVLAALTLLLPGIPVVALSVLVYFLYLR